MSTYTKQTPKKRKKATPRYDRIVGAIAVLIILIVLLVSCCKSCGNDDNGEKKTEESTAVTTQIEKTEEVKSSLKDESSIEKSDDFTTETKMPNAIYEGNLVLVNNQHEFSFPTDEDAVVSVYERKSSSYGVPDFETSLAPQAITALNAMMDAFNEKTGHSDCILIAAYKTKEEQDDKHSSGSSEIKGGYSEYHTGLSFDLGIFPEGESSYYYTADGDYAWIAENCDKYGYIIRYPDGKEGKTGIKPKTQQFRYVGIPHAIYMKEKKSVS